VSAKERFLTELVQRAFLEKGVVVLAPGDVARALAPEPVVIRPTPALQ
jgi:hypothetical protein